MAVKGWREKTDTQFVDKKFSIIINYFFNIIYYFIYNALTDSFPCVTVSEEAGIELRTETNLVLTHGGY
jgi:hypothetical protein